MPIEHLNFFDIRLKIQEVLNARGHIGIAVRLRHEHADACVVTNSNVTHKAPHILIVSFEQLVFADLSRHINASVQ